MARVLNLAVADFGNLAENETPVGEEAEGQGLDGESEALAVLLLPRGPAVDPLGLFLAVALVGLHEEQTVGGMVAHVGGSFPVSARGKAPVGGVNWKPPGVRGRHSFNGGDPVLRPGSQPFMLDRHRRGA